MAADKRSDIWAFGCVLFEMLTGRRPFEGQEVSDTLASVLKSDPEWHAMPAAVPPSVRALIEGCLKKDPNDRIADISTARFVLGQPLSTSSSPSIAVRTSPARGMWGRVLLVLAGAAIGAGAAIAIRRPAPAPPAPQTRFALTQPAGQQFTAARQAITISPDGRHIVYAADGRLYLRSMSSFEATVMAGTEDAISPMFSPDGQSLAFWANSVLKRVAIGGGQPVEIARGGQLPSAGSWDRDGILYSQVGLGILRIPSSGGKPSVIIPIDGSMGRADTPQMLPDGRTFLYTLLDRTAADENRWESARIVVQTVGGEPKTIYEGGSNARYVPTGHLVFAVRGSVLAVPFDLATPTIAPGAMAQPIVEGVRRSTATVSGVAQFDFSNTGAMVYVPGPTSEQEGVYLYDRKGGAQALTLLAGSYRYPRVSPDGKRVALESSEGREAYVSIYELSGKTGPTRITYGSNNRYPVWTDDGKHVAFQSDRNGDPAVFWQPIDGGTGRAVDETRARHDACARGVVAGRRAAVQRAEGLDDDAVDAVDGGWSDEGLRGRGFRGVTDQCGVLARRPLGRLSDRQSGCVGGIDLRAAVPGDRYEAPRLAAAAGRSGRATATSCSSSRRRRSGAPSGGRGHRSRSHRPWRCPGRSGFPVRRRRGRSISCRTAGSSAWARPSRV